jgi:N-formylglutamate amidohydrolase
MNVGWKVTEVGKGTSPLVLHVPHSSTSLPEPERDDLLLDDIELAAELGMMTDWYTDQLAFDGLASAGASATVFVNQASRLLVDPERFTGEDEPMLAVGMGPVYQATSGRQPLREPDPVRDQRLLDQWFNPYAAALTGLIDETLEIHGEVVIVDLHSFPSRPLPYELDQDAQRPDICIGSDLFHTSDEIRKKAQAVFREAGWTVAENTPFAGTYVPLKHLGRNRAVSSVMIEIRRDLYQEEPGGPRLDGFERVVASLSDFFRAVVGARHPV